MVKDCLSHVIGFSWHGTMPEAIKDNLVMVSQGEAFFHLHGILTKGDVAGSPIVLDVCLENVHLCGFVRPRRHTSPTITHPKADLSANGAFGGPLRCSYVLWT